MRKPAFLFVAAIEVAACARSAQRAASALSPAGHPDKKRGGYTVGNHRGSHEDGERLEVATAPENEYAAQDDNQKPDGAAENWA